MRTFFDMASSLGWLRCVVRTRVSEKFLYRYHRADLKMRDDLVHHDSFVVFRLSMSFRGSGTDVLLVKNEFTRIVFRLIDRVGNIAFLNIKHHPRGLTEAYQENSCQTPAPRHTHYPRACLRPMKFHISSSCTWVTGRCRSRW